MAKLLILGVLALFATLGSCFFLWQPVEELKYPNRSMLQTILVKPEIPSEFDNLRYPTQPLVPAWMTQAIKFITQKMLGVTQSQTTSENSGLDSDEFKSPGKNSVKIDLPVFKSDESETEPETTDAPTLSSSTEPTSSTSEDASSESRASFTTAEELNDKVDTATETPDTNVEAETTSDSADETSSIVTTVNPPDQDTETEHEGISNELI